jgi:diguanylate cyclase (GGDEF)-like protein
MRRRLARADVLTAMVRAVNASLEPEKIADALIGGLADWFPVSGWLVLVCDEGAELRTVATRGLSAGLEPAAQAAAEVVLRGGAMLCSADISTDKRLPRSDGFTPAAVIGFPLESRGRVVGALIAIDRAPSAREPRLAASTLAVLRTVLEPGAVALDNALRIQRAEALSVTDDLTQLYNSRYLSQVLRRETKRASRSGRPLSLLFIDLDGFKTVNDSHGHLAGSAALVEAAAVIRISARETDIVARFGGDEFALVLPDTGTEGAEMVGARIRDKIAVHQFLKKRDLDIRLTVSVGVATLPDVAASAEQLIHAADEAMYWVKERGKNGVHVAGTDGHTRNADGARMPGIPKDAATD